MKDLTTGSMRKTFLLFAIPLVLAGILSQGYNMIDTIIAGKYLGTEGLAATGATAALITVICSLFWGFGNGIAIYVARLFGAKEYKKLKSCIYINFIIVAIAAVIITVLMIIFHNAVFNYLKIDQSIRKSAFIYFSIYMSGLVIMTFNRNCIFIMHAFGMSLYPFLMSLISAFINVAGNILTIIFLGWGVAGVAISTVLSSLVVFVSYIFKLKKCFKEMNVDKYKVPLSGEIVKCSLPYSIPVTIQQVIMYLSSVLISPMINGLGSSATSAYTVILQIYNLSSSIYQESTKTLSNYTAQCMGAKKYSKIKKGIHIGITQSALFVLPLLIFCAVFSKQSCSVFFPSDHFGKDLIYAIAFVKFCQPFVLLNLINNAFHAISRAVKAMNMLMISTAIGAASRVIATAIFVKYYGMYGMYIGWVISWLAEMIFALYIYNSGRWRPDEMKNKI